MFCVPTLDIVSRRGANKENVGWTDSFCVPWRVQCMIADTFIVGIAQKIQKIWLGLLASGVQ